jgi:cytochrome b561
MKDMPATQDAATRYDRGTIALHWAVAGTVILLWLMGRLTGLLPKSPLRVDIWSMHVLIGFALAALVAARIWWRLRRGARLAPLATGAQHLAGVVVHSALYVAMIAVVALGIANVFGHGFPLFGVWRFPRFWDKPFQHQINEWHDLSANIIAALAVVHILAALYHHLILKDGVLRRMLPR